MSTCTYVAVRGAAGGVEGKAAQAIRRGSLTLWDVVVPWHNMSLHDTKWHFMTLILCGKTLPNVMQLVETHSAKSLRRMIYLSYGKRH